MKKFSINTFGLISLLVAGCTSYDDYGSNRYVRLELQDAISVENNQNYTVGDTIFIELNFSRYLDEKGFSNKLDIYESSGSEGFRYSFGLDKYSDLSGGFQRITITPEFLFAEKGTLGDFGDILVELNPEKTQYESKIGLILGEAGRFNLDFQYLYLESTDFFEDKVQIGIEHNFSNSGGAFEFIANE